MANLYANIAQVGSDEDFNECFNMITSRPAALLNLDRYGVAAGKAADLVVFDATSRREAVSSLSPVRFAVKRGVRTVTNPELRCTGPHERVGRLTWAAATRQPASVRCHSWAAARSRHRLRSAP